MSISIRSSAFAEGTGIPSAYTCDGEDISPPLEWSDAPDTTQSFAVICDDPDAPNGTWVHWIIYDIPADTNGIDEKQPHNKALSNGAKQGMNDFKNIGYGGPCPPRGTHRYFFRIYALDTQLGLGPGASKDDLVRAMEGHILEEGSLKGKYESR